jgi:hypothetical protein
VSPRIGRVPAHPYSGDPYLYLDQRTGRVFSTDLATIPPTGCSYLSYTDDGGRSWANSLGGCLENDHETVFAGPPPGGRTMPTGYRDVVYYCAIRGRYNPLYFGNATGCERSLDGGLTFLSTGQAPYSDPLAALTGGPNGQPQGDYGTPGACGGATGHGVVGSDGTIYLPRGWCGQPYLAISHDEGDTWTRVQVAHNGMPINDYGIREHEAAVTIGREGALFYFYVAHDRLPYLVASRDGGRTWGRPVRIGPAELREASLPAAVDETVGGRLAVAYVASTNSPGPPFPEIDDCRPNPTQCASNAVGDPDADARYRDVTWNGYISVSDDPLDPAPRFLNDMVNDPTRPLIRGVCGPVRCGAEYDFIDIVLDSHAEPWAVFIDGCSGPCPSGGQDDADEVVVAVPRAALFSGSHPSLERLRDRLSGP